MIGFAHRILISLKIGFASLAGALIFFVLLEVALRLLAFHPNAEISDVRVRADTYANADWVDDYFRELWQTQVGWEPYVYWRYKRFKGKYLNITGEGIRITFNSSSFLGPDDKHFKLFMFGGSTMFGTGARDSHTIPSIVSNVLHSEGFEVWIRNFGQSGYVSTQELSALIIELQKGNVPDLVVFYDGVNDVFSGYQSRVAGIPQNEINREIEFNSAKDINKAAGLFVGSLLRHSKLLDFFGVKKATTNMPGQREDQLARDIVSIYGANVKLIQGLAKEFGFQAIFYWQPTIFTKKSRSNYEEQQRENYEFLEPLTRSVLEELRNSKIPVTDLSDVFDEYQEPLYIDFCHLGERGNHLVGNKIAYDIQKVLETAIPN